MCNSNRLYAILLALFALTLAVVGAITPVIHGQSEQPSTLESLTLAMTALPGSAIVASNPTVVDIPPLPTDIQGYYLFPNQFLLQWRQWSDSDRITIFKCTERKWETCATLVILNGSYQGIRTATIPVQPHQFISFMELRKQENNTYLIYSTIPPFEIPDYNLRLPIVIVESENQ